MIDKSNFIEIIFSAEARAEVIAVIRPACVVAKRTRLWAHGLFLRSETEAANFGLNIAQNECPVWQFPAGEQWLSEGGEDLASPVGWGRGKYHPRAWEEKDVTHAP